MQLEDYFNFLEPDDIRIKGHRIGIESILYEYIHRGQTAEQIAERFSTLSLAQIYATILYYLQNEDSVKQYMTAWLEDSRKVRARQDSQTSAFRDRVRKLKTERIAAQRGEA